MQLIWLTVEQGPTVLAADAGCCLHIFLSPSFLPLSPLEQLDID